MVKYVCKSCNYRFERDDAFDCPYCGDEAIEKEKDAMGLLEEVEGLLSD